MEFWQNFIMFSTVNLEKPLILGIWAAIFGLLAIILDMGTYYIFRHKSFLKINYNHKSSNYTFFILVLIFYIICAGIVGFLGVIVNVLNFNIQSAVLTGFVWPTILSQIVKASEGDDEQPPGIGEELLEE